MIKTVQEKNFQYQPKGQGQILINREKTGVLQGTVYVGVMSAHKYLESRVDAAINTWMKYLPPNVKVELFADNVGELDVKKKIRRTSLKNGFQVIQLPGVSDHFYPPQKKSFSMLKFMHDEYLDKFDWFIRLDDDAYLEPRNLLRLLTRLNSSKPVFAGHVGYGLHKEDYLGSKDSFCMGGTGIVFSKQLLKQLAPKLSVCLNNLLTEHEDVEIGRCVQKMTGVQCTTSWETAEIFFQDFKTDTGYLKHLEKSTVDKVITFHPNKNPAHQIKLHVYLLQQKLKHLVTNIARLEKEIRLVNRSMTTVEQKVRCPGDEMPRNVFMDQAFFNSGRTLKSTTQTTFKKVLAEYDESVKLFIRKSGTSIQTMSRNFAYHQVNPLFSVDTVSKLKIAYLYGSNRNQEKIVKQRQYFPKRVQFFHEPINIDVNQLRIGENSPADIPRSLNFTEKEKHLLEKKETVVNFLMILSGRKDFFLRFLMNFESVFLKNKENVNLVVVYFPNNTHINAEEKSFETAIVEDNVEGLQNRYPDRIIKLVNMNETPYCKTVGLQVAKDQIKNDDEIIFFCDVDMVFSSPDFLRHLRRNTIQKKRAYYPVTFSRYNPQVINIADGASSSDFEYKETDGFWRYHGFGMLSIYKSDFAHTNGFDTKICGWGQEDVEMVNSVMKAGLDVFQSPVTNQAHVYHDKICVDTLPSNRLIACEAVRLLHYGAQTTLYKLYINKIGDFS